MPDSPSPALFLSYAREDVEAARRIAEALRSEGIDVWLDQSELRGGDAWDTKIRRQIRECALFLPLVSAQTQNRREGYFRREWRLAAERTHDMAPSRAFLVPVVIDETAEAAAEAPDEFLRVQWMRLPRGLPSPEFVTQVSNLLAAPRRLAPIAAEGPLTAAPLAGGKAIAVLAFANLSSDPENEYFSDGISEELLNVLAKIPGLRVTARTSGFHFKGKNLPIPDIARLLGVGYVVEGSVRRIGSRVRITAQLISGRDGFHVWSETFDRELKDIFALQDEIARLIAHNLEVKLSGALPPSPPVDPEAHRLVLEGRYFWNMRTEEGFRRAEQMFQRAIDLAPKFAPAYSGLADTRVVRAWYRIAWGLPEGKDEARQAVEPAETAIRLDPCLASAYPALGVVAFLEGRFDDSERVFQQALKLNPNFAQALHWHSHLLAARGRLDESLAELERSIALDPLAQVTLIIYAAHLNAARRYADVLAVTDRALALRNTLEAPLQGARAIALLGLGRNREALAAARLVGREEAPHMRWWAGDEALYVMRRVGDPGEAEGQFAAWAPHIPPGSPAFGTLLHALGRFDEALPYLRQAATPVFFRLYFHEQWDGVRADPRFQELFRHLKCEEEYRVAQQTFRRMQAAPQGVEA